MLEIKIKYFDPELEKIKFIEGKKSDWYDLRSSEEVTMKAGEFRYIKLGVGMKLPRGYEAHVAPRSSTFKNYGIIQANSVAVIDESFCGNDDQWLYPAIALRDTVIHKNDRICQFRIMKHQPKVRLTTVDRLDDKNRGGLGSSGKQ